MADEDLDLSEVRQEIDAVDDALHDLLMRRAQIIDRIKAAKTAGQTAIYRPGREALVLRRLAGRHSGSLPRATVIRMWRELMSAFVCLQGPFSCAVWDGNDGAYSLLAREHFGAVTPLSRYPSPGRALNAVSGGENTVGILPLPQDDDTDPWWPLLYGGRDHDLTICGRVPFDDYDKGAKGLVVGKFTPEETGEDRSYLVLETDGSLSRGRLWGALDSAGLPPITLLPGGNPRPGEPVLFLAEVDGFFLPQPETVDSLAANTSGIVNAKLVGACPAPLEPV